MTFKDRTKRKIIDSSGHPALKQLLFNADALSSLIFLRNFLQKDHRKVGSSNNHSSLQQDWNSEDTSLTVIKQMFCQT